jgi:hypothetical protein
LPGWGKIAGNGIEGEVRPVMANRQLEVTIASGEMYLECEIPQSSRVTKPCADKSSFHTAGDGMPLKKRYHRSRTGAPDTIGMTGGGPYFESSHRNVRATNDSGGTSASPSDSRFGT